MENFDEKIDLATDSTCHIVEAIERSRRESFESRHRNWQTQGFVVQEANTA